MFVKNSTLTFKQILRLNCASSSNRIVKSRNKEEEKVEVCLYISNYYFSHIMKYSKLIAIWNYMLFVRRVKIFVRQGE